VERERNPERRKFYELCWHLGGSQGDIANLKAEDVDWGYKTISFTRKKTGVPVILHLGESALNVLKDLPSEGMLFPYLSRVRASDRATEFRQRCRGLGIEGLTLHAYRFAWAERAKTAGYPERFAQEALGHNSVAVHRAYAKKAKVKLPSLEEYEKNSASGLNKISSSATA
jgi:integrase